MTHAPASLAAAVAPDRPREPVEDRARSATMLVLHHEPAHPPGADPAVASVADDVQATYDELRANGV